MLNKRRTQYRPPSMPGAAQASLYTRCSMKDPSPLLPTSQAQPIEQHHDSSIWPDAGWRALKRTPEGWHQPSAAWWLRWLDRPELAPPPEACRHERRLADRLQADPGRTVKERELTDMADADARDNWRLWLKFRDDVQAAGTLEAWYLRLMRSGQIHVPPLFIDDIVQDMVRGLLDDLGLGQGGSGAASIDGAFTVRAAELLFRSQRVTVHDGAMLAGDSAQLDVYKDTGGFGELGRLLREAQVTPRRVDLRVLSAESAADFWSSACAHPARRDWLLDLRHEVNQDLGHGIHFTVQRKHSGLGALSQVLERWVWHLLRVAVRIQPLARVDDPQWRWHTGLDVVSSALLNDLYEGHDVDPARQQQLISLFKLEFEQPQEMLHGLQGAKALPVYLGLAQQKDGLLKLKPQNLVLNLPVMRD
jgi:Family of unknown function (DUF6352)